MLATQTDSIKTGLNTFTSKDKPDNISPTSTSQPIYTRSVIGRTYWQLLTNLDITHLNANTTPLRYNQTKGLTCRPSEKMAWATTLLAHPDILITYEEGLHES
jgi:hypothetical protein